MSSLIYITDKSEIDSIVSHKPGYPPPPQIGPLRFTEQGRKCLAQTGSKKGCLSPTSITIYGTPMCSVHALHALNNMVAALKSETPTGCCPKCRESDLEYSIYGEISCNVCAYVKQLP